MMQPDSSSLSSARDENSAVTSGGGQPPLTVAAQCVTCGKPHCFRWTDSHGIGVCSYCGTPYYVYHYDDASNRIDKAPECALDPMGIEFAKRYYEETHRMVYPGAFDMGLRSGRDYTYSGASMDDITAFEAWYVKQPEVVAAAIAKAEGRA